MPLRFLTPLTVALLLAVGLFLAISICLNTVAVADAPVDLPAKTRIAIVGNGTAQRMGLFGHFETMLHLQTSDQPVVLRNFGWPADAVGNQVRPGNYTVIDDPMQVFAPEYFVCFFGMNESFAGTDDQTVNTFQQRYHRYLDELDKKFSTPSRKIVTTLVTPIAFEPTGNPLQPDGTLENERLAIYAEAVRRVATERDALCLDAFKATRELFLAKPGNQYTTDGLHLNEQGDEALALILDEQLFGGDGPKVGAQRFEKLRKVVNDKAWLHAQDYRMLNGWYVYGGRRTWDTETFPGEYRKIRKMVAVRDQVIWDIAAGKPVPDQIDDSATGEVFIPETMFGSRDEGFRKMREPPTLDYPTPKQSISQMTIPDGFKVQCFASEKEFPELANPTQIAFDERGRLWVSCMVNYPQWLPGGSRPDDRLLILEDTDKDGKADKCTRFYDELICPTGFEFYKDGVLVVDEPHILFLRDTDGDDRADEVTHLLDGIATEDTHHAMGAWEYSNGGRLHLLEGIALSTTLETPWGPIRKQGASGSYVWDLESMRMTHFRTPGTANPWCLVFDKNGNGIVGDGTNAQHYWANALSGGEVKSRKSLDPIFNNHGIRPAAGNEILTTRQFPNKYHSQLIYACVINMHGMPSFELRDPNDAAAPAGERTDDLLVSDDMFFRPVDPKIGPDGALWFGDWCNALIGHMQYSQRDPNRDHEHGRIYRLIHKETPLLAPAITRGESVDAIIGQLTAYESRTRYRARRALRARPEKEVLSGIKQWLNSHADVDSMLEALWVQESFHAVDLDLAIQIIQQGEFAQRAAAAHVLGNQWRYLTGNEQARTPDALQLSAKSPLLELLAELANDSHPRVRVEALRAASLIDHPAALSIALSGLQTTAPNQSSDKMVDYVREHTMSALARHWDSDAPKTKAAVAKLSPEQALYLKEYKIATGPGAEVYAPLKVLANVDAKRDDQLNALKQVVAAKTGSPKAGRKVFDRVCSACHRYQELGKKFGPELTNLGERMSKEHLIRSIVWPNEEISKGYETVMLVTYDGEAIAGFVLSEDDESITLGVADGKTKVVEKEEIELQKSMKNSSMPEGLTETIAPGEFLDLLAFLTHPWIATNPNLDFPLRENGDLIEVSRDSMVRVPNHFPRELNNEAEHLLSGEGVRKRGFAVHLPSQSLNDQAVIIRLSKAMELVKGRITNRKDGDFGNRTVGLTVWVATDSDSALVDAESLDWKEVWKSPGVKPVWDFSLPQGTVTRYLKIGLNQPGILNIDRTVFFGRPASSNATQN